MTQNKIFRAWDNDKNYYISTFYIRPCGTPFLLDRKMDDDILNATLEQWTGLKDKNGVKIFEGDIFTCTKYPFESDGLKNYVGLVVYTDHPEYLGWFYDVLVISDRVRGGACGGSLCEISHYDLEVIGNVHTDSSLLEGGE